MAGSTADGQRIVVDSASSNNYLIAPEKDTPPEQNIEEVNFGERAFSIGKGILNRLKARLNLEEAAESIQDKKERLLGRKPEDTKPSEE